MGSEPSKFNSAKLSSTMKSAKARLQLARSNKENAVTKTKKLIKDHLEKNEEAYALIKTDLLINDEGRIKCIDLLITFCQEVLNQIPSILHGQNKPPVNMLTVMYTLVYSAEKIGIQELLEFKAQVASVYGKKFIQEAEQNVANHHPIIRENINLIAPEDGMKVERLLALAREEGMVYNPSKQLNETYQKYLMKKSGVALGPSMAPTPPTIVTFPGQPAPASQELTPDYAAAKLNELMNK